MRIVYFVWKLIEDYARHFLGRKSPVLFTLFVLPKER